MPPSAEPLDTTLREGLQALGLEATEAQVQGLLAYRALIERWNRVYNLTAVRESQAMVVQHLLDSLAALPHVRAALAGVGAGAGEPHGLRGFAAGEGVAVSAAAGGALQILDVGSGAGLPGVVWAQMEPRWQVCCVDAVAKKAGFVRQVAAELALPNLRAEHARVEDLPRVGVTGQGFEVVTSRAFASLADFTALTTHLLAPHGVWLAMKGRVPDDEIAALPPDVRVFHVERLTVPGLAAERCLIWLRRAEA
jgi:16S rRNA (guanine527-N7)-methyltransferase